MMKRGDRADIGISKNEQDKLLEQSKNLLTNNILGAFKGPVLSSKLGAPTSVMN
jgi:hypothetical protein